MLESDLSLGKPIVSEYEWHIAYPQKMCITHFFSFEHIWELYVAYKCIFVTETFYISPNATVYQGIGYLGHDKNLT